MQSRSLSTLFLTFAYRLDTDEGLINLQDVEARLGAAGTFPSLDGKAPWDVQWSRRNLDDAALLPHLDVQTRRGELLRVFRFQGPGLGLFDGRTWRLTSEDGKKSIDAVFSGP